MNHTEFWNNVESIFGSAYGRALCSDLALPALGHVTAVEALDDNANPQLVWQSLCDEMGLGERMYFAHRLPRSK